MKRLLMLGVLGMAGIVGACGSGGQGPAGPAGAAGTNGTDGANGEAGAPGAAGSSAPANPSLSGITPPRTFLARSAEITISGYGTSWSSATTVDFGAGVTVNKLTVASPTAIIANITTTKAAAVGARDVTVKDGATTETYKGAFQVISPIAATFLGSIAQGALAEITFQVIDTSTPLDTTSTTDPLTGAVTYTNLAVTLPAGVTNQAITAASDFGATMIVSVDVDAKAATGDLDLVSGPAGATTNLDFPMPAALKIAARTPTALVSGTAATGSTATAYDSALYSFTPGAATTIVDFSASSTSAAVTPRFALLPSSGHFADLIGYGAAQTLVTSAAQPSYAVYWDNSGNKGPFSVTALGTAAASAAASTADNTKAGAVAAASLPFVLTGGDLSKGTGADWVKITATAASTLHLQTVGDLNTDTAVTVYQANGMTAVGMPVDTGGAADGTVAITAAGTYYVVFSQGMSYATSNPTYTGIIRAQ